MKLNLRKSKKAASFFLFDAVIATLIFFMTLAIILSIRNVEPDIETPKVFGENLMEYYLKTEVRQIEDPLIGELMISRKINDPSNTLLEQMIIFYALGLDTENGDFVETVSGTKIPPSYGFNVTISNLTDTKVIYEKSASSIDTQADIRLKRVGITKLPNGSIYGPLIIGVNVWY